MNDLINMATVELARFLTAKLPCLSIDWWEKHVVQRLSFQQQRMLRERGFNKLQQLDFAGLIRVLDQNWNELSDEIDLPHEGRNWVKELQSIRNRWAHLSAEVIPHSEVYRDADTLGRLMDMIDAEKATQNAVESTKSDAIASMAQVKSRPPEESIVIPGENELYVKIEDPIPVNPDTSSIPSSLFKVGDLVTLRSNQAVVVPVIDVDIDGAECRYVVFQNNSRTTYYESQLQASADESDDFKSLTAFELQAHLTGLQILSPSTTNLFSLRSGRIQFVPYQYRPVLKLIRSDRPRLLIADEVGVGKTIEAGLIIKELSARMELASVLIICPKALVSERKWYLEMKRFDENFTALDGPLLRHCLRETHLEGEWPEQYAKAILPFSLFDSNLVFGKSSRGPGKDWSLLDLDPPPKFDLIIVDEAHHIRNSETFLHQGVRYLCDNAEAVLFLTATPVQLGSEDLYTLLNVLRPDLVIDHASFEEMASPNRHINAAIQHCRRAEEDWQNNARGCMDEVAQTEWGGLFIRESTAFQSIYDRLNEDALNDTDRIGLIRAIEELYTFSSLINRTRRRDIGEFTTRKPETLTIDFTAAQKQLHDTLLDVVARILAFCHGQQNVKFMMTTIRRQAASCLYGLAPLLQGILNGKLDQLEVMEATDNDTDTDLGFVRDVRSDIEILLQQARNLDPHDPKVEAFVQVLTKKSKLPNNKALVFSTFRHTLAYLARHMRETGLRYGLVHGGVDDEDRAELRRRFALPIENAEAIDVLLSSEVSSEGLDFQFCDFLVNYDLPWNPMRIEQRIGRIDRYGQESETVAIINFVTPGTVDADIYERCLWRIGLFQHAVGGNEEILGQITKEIHDIAESFQLSTVERQQRLQQVADNGIRQVQIEEELESKQAELFGLNIPNQSWREEIEAAESYWLSPFAIQRCVTSYLATHLGTEHDHILGEKTLKTLRLSQESRNKLLSDYKQLPRSTEPVARAWEKWLKGVQPTLSVTFDQSAASENPRTVHLSVMHPIVRQAAHLQRFDKPVTVRLTAHSTKLPQGEHKFALYHWNKQGVRPDDLLIAVAADIVVENALLSILESARDLDASALVEATEYDALDARHHIKWTVAQAEHIAENRLQVEHRIQSLTVSHRARCKAIEDQIERTTNDKIHLMRQSELARANADFRRRMEILQQSADSGDIHATVIVNGTLAITTGVV